MTTFLNRIPPKKDPRCAVPMPAKTDVPFMRKCAGGKLKHLLDSYVPQFNRYACSAASLAMIINAIRRGDGAKKNLSPITQQDLLERVEAVHWRERLSLKGYKGRHGVTLEDLRIICVEALAACDISCEAVETLVLNETMVDLSIKKGQAHRELTQMATSENDFILAYFTQGELVGEWFGSHVSPVGSFDPERQAVLLLDVDPEINGPYQVSFDRFFNSLVGRTNTYHRRGGGWVYLRIRS